MIATRCKVSGLLLALTAALTLKVGAAPPVPPGALLDEANPRVLEVMTLQNAVTPDLMALDGILGTAVSLDGAGQLALVIYVNDENANKSEIMSALPKAIRGVPVSGQLTDRFRALSSKPGGNAPPGGGVSHTALQTPPIQLGTSGGWGYDLANGYCCEGTLGSLVQIGTTQYIMSNYHVFESDIVLGGNNRIATDGDAVIQPGLVDVSCNAAGAQGVGTLHKVQSLPGSNVDVSIALVTTGKVRTDGSILGIGTISKSIVAPYTNQGVKKSGRTSGLTRSTVAGLNATVSVTYDNECAGGTAFTKTFTGQIVINNRNKGQQFLVAGDSGSLMVEDVSTNPRAAGLLYAGSSTYAIANPIGEVLGFLGATMVGQ